MKKIIYSHILVALALVFPRTGTAMETNLPEKFFAFFHSGNTNRNLSQRISPLEQFFLDGLERPLASKQIPSVLHYHLFDAIKNNDPLEVENILKKTTPENRLFLLNKTNNQGFSPLRMAMENENISPDLITTLIESGADKNTTNSSGRTPLHVVIGNNRLDLGQRLIKLGVNINTKDNDGWNVFHDAIREGRLKTIKFLYTQNTSVLNAPTSELSEIKTPLHIAALCRNVKTVQMLLDFGADTTIEALNKWNALHYAAQGGHPKIIEILYKKNSSLLNAPVNTEATPLHVALCNQNFDAARKLLDLGANTGSKDVDGWTPLHYAAKNCDAKMIELLYKYNKNLLNDKDLSGCTPLHSAALNNNQEAIKKLIDLGANPHLVDIDGQTPLHLLTGEDNSNTIELLYKSDKSLINARSNSKTTPIHITALNGDLGGTKTLLRLGADSNLLDCNDFTTLHYAAVGGNVKIIDLLYQQNNSLLNATTNQNTAHQTPLHIAVSSGKYNAVKKLIELGAPIDTKSLNNWTAFHYAAQEGNLEIIDFLYKKKPSLIESLTSTSATPLHIAAANGKLGAVKKFIELGVADFNATDINGWTVLHFAVQNNYPALIDFLLEKNPSLLNTPDIFKKTPLHIAVLSGNIKTVKKLVQFGANLNDKDINENNVLHCAAQEGNLDVIEFLGRQNPSLLKALNNNKLRPLNIAAATKNREVLKKFIELELREDKKATSLNNQIKEDKNLNELSKIYFEEKEQLKKKSLNKKLQKKEKKKQIEKKKRSDLQKNKPLELKNFSSESSINKYPQNQPKLFTKSEIDKLVEEQNKKSIESSDGKLTILYRTWGNTNQDVTLFLKKPKKQELLGVTELNLDTASPHKQDMFHKIIVNLITKQWLLDHAKIITYNASTCNTDQRFVHFSKKYNIKKELLENNDILLVFPGFLCTGSSVFQLFEHTKKMVLDNLTSEKILLSVKQKANIDKHISSGAGVCIIRSIDNKKTVIHSCFQNETPLNSLN